MQASVGGGHHIDWWKTPLPGEEVGRKKGGERQAFQEGEGKVGEGVYWQVRPYRWPWGWGAPIEGHDIWLKFRAKGSVGVRRPGAL